jgi:FG-GAP repeat protein
MSRHIPQSAMSRRIVVIALALAAGLLASPSGITSARDRAALVRRALPVSGPSPVNPGLRLPAEADAAISATLGRDITGYHVVPHATGFHAENRDNGLSAEFTREGVRVRAGAAQWGVRLRSVGYGPAPVAGGTVSPRAVANRVEYPRGAVTEWYVNGPAGLEQGFSVAAPRGKSDGRPLTLALGTSGDLTASLDAAGDAITLKSIDGKPVMRYRGLSTVDADLRTLRSWFDVAKGEILIRIDDRGARYPIVVDPFIQQAKLIALDGAAANASFGNRLAYDGDTVVVGAPGGNAAYVFVRPAGGWSATMTETARLSGSDVQPGDAFGFPVAVHGDTVAVGARFGTPGNDLSLEGFGGVYVFTRPAGGWASTSDATKLLPEDFLVSDNTPNWDPISLAVGDDVVVVGSPFVADAAGIAYVFARPAGGWGTGSAPYPLLTEAARLSLPEGSGAAELGSSVGISGDTIVAGATAAATDPDSPDLHQGAAYLFAKPSGGWTSTSTFAAQLSASDGADGDQLGSWSSIDGGEVAVGAVTADVGSNVDQGAAYVFVKPVGGWTTMTETTKLTASDGAASDSFGNLAISGDLVVVGATAHNAARGQAYLFLKPAGGWPAAMTENEVLTADDGVAGDRFGIVAAVGNTVVVGAYRRTETFLRQGAAYVFQAPAVGCDDGNPCTDDASGVFGCSHTNNTVTCDDGNPDTVNDACSGGVCAGVDRCAGVVCAAPDGCHQAGTCDHATGLCSSPILPDGSACSDGNACTQTDICKAGVCTGGNLSWSGFLQPINGDDSSIFKLGSTIPVKFQLTGACSGIVNAVAHLLVAKVSNSVVGTEMEAVSTSAADAGNTFRYDTSTGQYIFNLSTKSLNSGSWALRVDLGDDVANRVVTVSLKK